MASLPHLEKLDGAVASAELHADVAADVRHVFPFLQLVPVGENFLEINKKILLTPGAYVRLETLASKGSIEIQEDIRVVARVSKQRKKLFYLH